MKSRNLIKLGLILLAMAVLPAMLLAQSRSYNVTLRMRSATVKTVADAVKTQMGGVAFSYESAIAGKSVGEVNINERNASLEKILSLAFPSSKGFSCETVGSTVVISWKEQEIPVKTNGFINVTGKVTDTNGEPVPGVAVYVDAGKSGTTTGMDGTYAIKAAENGVIRFSCMGYSDASEKVGGRSVVNVVLSEDSMLLEETVIVGYGTQRKVDLTGAVSSIDYGKTAGNRTIVSTSASLAGLAAGMSVTQSSGQPGSDGATIRIRGLGSFSSGSLSPLVLVDGVEWSMDNVNPNDIASISVLKDAASTAIYGTRAANGVILITTKTGSEASPQVTYSFKGIIQTPYNHLHFVSDYADHMSYMNEACDNVGTSRIFSQSNIDLWREKKLDPNGVTANGVPNYVAYPNTDWFEELFQTGFSHEHNISVSGGSKKVKYLISGGYLDNEGVMGRFGIDSSSKKFNFRSNVEADVKDWIKVGMRLFGQRQTYGLAGVSSAFGALYQTTPGVYIGTVNAWGSPALNSEESTNANNIFANLYGSGGYNNTTRLNGTAFINFHIKDFSLEATGNYSPSFGEKHTYGRPNGRWNYNEDIATSTSSLENAGSAYTTSRAYYLTGELLARYTKTFGKHYVNVMAGYSVKTYESWGWGVSKKGATDWSMDDLGTFDELYSYSNTSRSGWGLQSVFGRINYSFKDRYLVEANVRADGSSKFGPNYKYGVFPSISFGWRIDQEDFMAPAKGWLSNLKLRASYGKTGNNNGIGNYAWQATYNTANVVVDSNPTKGLYIASLSNENLHWETTSTTDIGIDSGFFGNKLTADIDYYYRNTSDILYTMSNIHWTMGEVSGVPSNLGTLWNQGVELSLNWRNAINKDLSYYVGVNAAYNKNKVTSFNGPLTKGWFDGKYVNNLSDATANFGSGKLCEGHALGEHYLRKLYRGNGKGYTGGAVDINAGPVDGMIRTQKDFDWVQAMMDSGYSFNGSTSLSKSQIWYGDLIYQDSDGDKNFGDDDDMDFNGHSDTPSFTLGINMGMKWKNFDLNMTWSGAFGFWIIWNTNYYNGSGMLNGYGLIDRVAKDHYFFDADNADDPRTSTGATYPRLTYGVDLSNRLPSEFYEYKGDYLKLKNIQLGYSLPSRLTKLARIEDLRFFVSGENILTLTPFIGLDPEKGNAIGYPLMRQFTIGAQVTF